MLTLCMTLISLSNLFGADTRVTLSPIDTMEGIEALMYAPVTPVIIAFFATLLLGLNMNIVKYFDKKGFPADVFAFGCYGATNLIQAAISVVVFYHMGFNKEYFFFGFCGSFLNTVGLVLVALAVSSGLSGPSSALVNL